MPFRSHSGGPQCWCSPAHVHPDQHSIIYVHNDEIGVALNLHPLYLAEHGAEGLNEHWPLHPIVNEGPTEWDGFRRL